MAKEILIPQQSFTGDNAGFLSYYYAELINTTLESDGVTPLHVIFDGTEYAVEAVLIHGDFVDSYRYGAIQEGGNYDFSTYPFSILADSGMVECCVADGNEHTIEAYVGEEKEEVFHQHSNVRTQDNQIFYFDENTGDFIFFDGDSWGQNNDAWGKGIVQPKSKVAVVGTAIVGLDVVGRALVNTALVDSAIVDTDITG